ncbi:MAG: hypothetical protein WC184_06310 [Acidimicrobiia bacterium]
MGLNPFRPNRGSRVADIAFVVSGLTITALAVAWAMFGNPF